MINQWYKNAIVYGLDVKTYKDSDGDGIGDFQGLIGRLDYLASLGVTCLWLLPFHPSPKQDDGYDVCDYYNVDPLLGNLGDFVQLIHEADQRGIRILMDLVVNHTSIEHPWFQEARKDRNSKYRDYYVWTDEPKENKQKVMFEGIEESIWKWVEETDSYYLHRFFKEQADLNMANPAVREEVLKIAGFWLKLGVSGFRLDASHIITDTVDVEHIDFGNLHQFFSQLRDFVDERNPNAVLLGEANVPPEELQSYFGDDNGNGNDRIHMLFNFLANKHTYLAFARKEGAALNMGLRLYEHLEIGHWINFIRHHDELNLELLSEQEREEVMDVFAPEEHMRIFGHGIRRRLAPMMMGDMSRIKFAYALIFALPGTPLLSYGEEIGMGDELELKGRDSVRTPMQWANEKNGGFSTAPEKELYRPVIDQGNYSYAHINVRDQQRKPDSFLNWIASLIRFRRQNSVIGFGKWAIVPADSNRITAVYYEKPDGCLLVVYNFSDRAVEASLTPGFIPRKLEDVFCEASYQDKPRLDKLALNPYGWRWIQVLEKEEGQTNENSE